MSVLDDLLRVMADLPPDPIRAENRGVAGLLPTSWVEPGQVYRLAPQPYLTGHHRPLIVMNTDDVDALREGLRPALGEMGRIVDLDQEIADCCEQMFADRERAERGRPS